MGGRLDAVRVHAIERVEVGENIAELGGVRVDLLVSEVDTREAGDVQDGFTFELHVKQDTVSDWAAECRHWQQVFRA